MVVLTGGVDGPRRLVRVVILVHLPFSSRSLDPSLFQACLWRALYVALLGPGCLIRTVWKYNMLLLFTDIIFIIHLCPIFLRRLSTVALLRERRPWFAGRYLSTFWRGFTEHASGRSISSRRSSVCSSFCLSSSHFWFHFHQKTEKLNTVSLGAAGGADHLTLEGGGGWFWKNISCKRLWEEKNCMQHKCNRKLMEKREKMSCPPDC